IIFVLDPLRLFSPRTHAPILSAFACHPTIHHEHSTELRLPRRRLGQGQLQLRGPEPQTPHMLVNAAQTCNLCVSLRIQWIQRGIEMPKPTNLRESLPSLWRISKYFWPHARKYQGLMAASLFALFAEVGLRLIEPWPLDRKSTRLNSSHVSISYAV